MVDAHHPHLALAARVGGPQQRHVDHLAAGRPAPDHQRGVHLDGATLAELVLQRGQRAALLGQQQHARGLLVEPVHELEEPRLRPSAPQLLDDAEAHARTAVNRHPGGLVDRQQVFVLVQDREFARRRGERALGALGSAHRRHPYLVAQCQARVGRGAALVEAHLARADHAVDMRLGHALEHAKQEVVQPLAFAALVDHEALHPGGAFGAYNRLDHVAELSA